MESTGLPEKIQISEVFKTGLETYYPEFNYTLRGSVEIKVRGTIFRGQILERITGVNP